MAVCLGLLLAFLAGAGAGTTSPESMALAAVPSPAPGAPQLAALFAPPVQFWADSLRRWSESAGVDINLAATVMQIESCGDPRARSSAGAMGLFQVMPFHFLGTDSPYDPDTNALRGLAYLRQAFERAGGDARLALAGYNGGIGVIGRSESSWAAETVRYAYWGSGIFTDASAGADQSPRLAEWLSAGGASLCRQAGERLGISP